MDDIGCHMFAIPACSPDLNPIENMFHLVRANLKKDALTKEIKKRHFWNFQVAYKRLSKAHQLKSWMKPLTLCLRDLQRL